MAGASTAWVQREHGLAAHSPQRARGGHSQRRHGLAGHVLPQRGAQHGAAVGVARVRRAPGALQLQLPRLERRRVDHLPQADGPPVAQLAGPGTELVACGQAECVRSSARRLA